MIDPTIYLPQVKSIHLDFDKKFIHQCLKEKSFDKLKGLKWPEAWKPLYRAIDKKENELLHIESCCRKAREETIIPVKNAIWNEIIKNNLIKEV